MMLIIFIVFMSIHFGEFGDQVVVVFDYILIIFDIVRRHLGTFGVIWRFLGTFGIIWRYLGTFGVIWPRLALSVSYL